MVRLTLLAGAASLLLAACRWSAGAETGTYSATLTGAVDTTFTGRAQWEGAAGLDEFDYAVHMLLPGKGPEFGIYLFFRERPAPGVSINARAAEGTHPSAAHRFLRVTLWARPGVDQVRRP